MKVYHYASIDDWKEIKEGSYDSDYKPGLAAKRRVGKYHNEAWNTEALFALLNPTPKDWITNQEFPNIWPHLKRDIGKVLLSIDVDENDENVFVIDRAKIQRFFDQNNTSLTTDEKKLAREKAEGEYISSKIPFKEYFKNAGKPDFILPEVIFTKHVPIEKVSINEDQPLLQEFLDEEEDSEYKLRYIKKIKEIPELKNWYEDKYLKQETSNEIKFNLR